MVFNLIKKHVNRERESRLYVYIWNTYNGTVFVYQPKSENFYAVPLSTFKCTYVPHILQQLNTAQKFQFSTILSMISQW